MERKSADIVALTPNHLPIGGTPQGVVNLLVDLVKKAERGELRGMAVAWVEGQNSIYTQIAEGCAGSSLLVASVSALFYEINQRWAGK